MIAHPTPRKRDTTDSALHLPLTLPSIQAAVLPAHGSLDPIRDQRKKKKKKKKQSPRAKTKVHR
ncbi:hypothetical protein OFC47_26735, partial [Escherichia coli]|nr:hypothetical protein [Escherichia coli]